MIRKLIALLVVFAVVATTMAGPVKDCETCIADVKAGTVCNVLDLKHLIACIEDLVKLFPDCKHCVCDIAKAINPNAC